MSLRGSAIGAEEDPLPGVCLCSPTACATASRSSSLTAAAYVSARSVGTGDVPAGRRAAIVVCGPSKLQLLLNGLEGVSRRRWYTCVCRPRISLDIVDTGNFYGNTIWILFSFPVTRYSFVGNPGFSNTNTLPIGTRTPFNGVWPRLFLSTPSRKTSAQGLALI